jgi:acetyl esterase/lipase
LVVAYCREGRSTINGISASYQVGRRIELRLSGEASFPAQIEDCKAAVRWLRANAAKYNLDADRIGAWGHSAGGHLSALLGTSGGVQELEGNGDNMSYSSRVQAVCVASGSSDILRLYHDASDAATGTKRKAISYIDALLGGPAEQNETKAIAASPITYVSKDDPPFSHHPWGERLYGAGQSRGVISRGA